MSGQRGIELLEIVKKNHPATEVILIIGFGSMSSAVDAMTKSTSDYISKPFDIDELLLRVKKIIDQKTHRKENIAPRNYFGIDRMVFIIAKSAGVKARFETVESIKESDVNMLLICETGVGKSLIAKLIYFTSRRQERPFLSINCAPLTEDLLASELFEHGKGAFSGTVTAKHGLVEIAVSGTLFLDEIAELSANLQAKLLNVVEKRESYS